MNDALVLNTAVPYGAVDRDELLLLPGVFKLLQEAAIKHADQFNLGTRAIVARGESWVLNRLAAAIHRYPRYEEPVRIVTWSSGIQTCKGFRDFRLYCGDELAVSASSLWLYVNLQSRSLVRVPPAVAAQFPSRADAVFHPHLDKLKLPPPEAGAAQTSRVSVRYSDIDANGHVNNTAYFDFLQTALDRCRLAPRPSSLEIQFLREIPVDAESVDVGLETQGPVTRFGIGDGTALFAQGQIG
jgi:medium-chain acyl-[acyl-carrier-protein] hydrolase